MPARRNQKVRDRLCDDLNGDERGGKGDDECWEGDVSEHWLACGVKRHAVGRAMHVLSHEFVAGVFNWRSVDWQRGHVKNAT